MEAPVQRVGDGIGGILIGLLTIVLLAWIVASLAAVNIPIPVSTAMTAAVLAFLILIFAVIKTSSTTTRRWARWVGVVLAAIDRRRSLAADTGGRRRRAR